MLNVLSRFQLTMLSFTAAMVVATGLSAIDMSKRHRFLDGAVSGTTIADLGEMMSTVDRFQSALVADRGGADGPARARSFNAIRSRLAAMEIGTAAATEQSRDEQLAREALKGAMLDLQILAIDGDDPSTLAKVERVLSDVRDALQTLALAATSNIKQSVAEKVSLSEAALRLHLALLATTVLCGMSLFVVAVRRGLVQHSLARRDALTGLMNRFSFSETLSRLVADPGPGNDVGLILLDLDHFKIVNDTLGHAAGDLLLKQVAARLSTLADEAVHVARLGGDEFALVLVARRAHSAATEKVERIRRLLAQPIDLGTRQVTAGMSIGVAVTPLGWYDAHSLLKNADIALYAAKAAGRGASRSFTSRMDRELRERRQLEDDLRLAVATNKIEVHFQPLVDLRSERVVACEALARWNRPGYGLVPPTRFIDIAEEGSLIGEIGASILLQACRAAREWPEDVRICVNISASQFNDEFVGVVTATLAATGLAPARLELEITESVLVKDGPSVERILGELRGIGVQIALDDFGTGFSTLSHLRRFAIDRIKIDRSFVRDMSDSPESMAIVEAVCLLARKLGLSTTAEGIETETHASLLRTLGCAEGQGYLFHRPMSLVTCTETILSGTRTTRAA